MDRSSHHVFLCSITVLLILVPLASFAAEENSPVKSSEIGVPSSAEDMDSHNFRELLLDDLGAQLDFGLGYNILTGQGVQDTYSGLPQVGVGISFLVTHHIRTFLRVDYAFASTDPFEGAPGFDTPQETSIRSVPMTFGLKFNMSQNKRLRLYMGLGMQVAWQQEETIDISYDGNVSIEEVSGFNFGFVGTFGPEIVLWNENLLGLEFGLGGSKGDIANSPYGHSIDTTGFTTRLYYAINL